jgi:hypothetical protein
MSCCGDAHAELEAMKSHFEKEGFKITKDGNTTFYFNERANTLANELDEAIKLGEEAAVLLTEVGLIVDKFDPTAKNPRPCRLCNGKPANPECHLCFGSGVVILNPYLAYGSIINEKAKAWAALLKSIGEEVTA